MSAHECVKCGTKWVGNSSGCHVCQKSKEERSLRRFDPTAEEQMFECADGEYVRYEDAMKVISEERRAGGALADAVGRYIDGGCNDEEGLGAALSAYVQGAAP